MNKTYQGISTRRVVQKRETNLVLKWVGVTVLVWSVIILFAFILK